MPKKYKGISRIDSDRTHGWFVRVYRKGKTHSAFFADLKCLGKSKALALALKAYDELVAKLPAKNLRRVRTGKGKNSTGIVGVNRYLRKNLKGSPIDCFVVNYRPEPNFPRQKVFSINKWGEEVAFKKAVEFRRQMEKKILRGTAKA